MLAPLARSFRNLLLSLLFIVFNLCIGLTVQASTSIQQRLASMSDEQLAAQMILVYYTTPEFVLKHEFGGILIMQNMLKDPDKLKHELHKLQTHSHNKVLVSIDQEGGKVNRMKRLPGWQSVASAAEMANWSNHKITRHAKKMASVLTDLGINMNLAPVLDPSHDFLGQPTFMGQENRAFGANEKQITAKASAYINGFKPLGMASIAKHFPGYDVQSNSDHEIAISNAPMKALNEQVKTFSAIAPQVEGIMMSSIHFSAINGKPAVLSPKMVAWARETMHDRLIMTDDLWGTALRKWMEKHGARSDNAQVVSLTQLAIEAGNDVLMITYPEKAILMKRNIVKWMRDDENVRIRVKAAVKRILMTKQTMGLLDETSVPIVGWR